MKAVVSCIVAGSLLLAAAEPSAAAGKDEEPYIKVMAKGRFHFPPPKAPLPDRPKITIGQEDYELDLSSACEARKVESLRRLDGEIVLLEGRLELRRANISNRTIDVPVIVVSSIRPAKPK